MCGIFGISHNDTKQAINQRLLEESAGLIRHRGPDGTGVYSGNGIGLAHTRLSLIDLDARSDQPIWDDSGRYCIIYNGEVYNFQSLKEELKSLGYSFRTTSDTEVILYSLIHFGLDALKTFEGMFSIAFYDKEKDTLHLARDRFGIKPLYFFQDDNSFLFASEINSFRPWINLELDTFSISSYLMGYGGPNAHFTFFSGVKILPPGNVMQIKNGRVEYQKKFFDIDDFVDHDEFNRLSNTNANAIVDEMEQLLIDSIDKHMIADIPVGALCSGGVDSSLLMAIASKKNKNLSIFHANVKGPLSELEAAEKLARHLDLDMKTVDIEDDDFLDKMPQVTEHFGQPFIYHPNSVPFLMVCNLVQEHNVKAILTGEAADECFLGYSHIPTEDLFSQYYRMLNGAKRLVHKVPFLGSKLWPAGEQGNSVVRNLHNRFEEDSYNIDRIVNKHDKGTEKTLNYLKYHLRTLLHRNDCLGMASSIEARFPFLDHNLVKFSVNLPYKNKIKFSREKPIEKKHPFIKNKWIVRQVADRYIPAELSQRPKQGFPTNAFERMNISNEYFNNSFVQDLFQLSSNEIKMLVQQSDQNFLVRLLHLDVWGQTCFNQEDKNLISSRLKQHIKIAEL